MSVSWTLHALDKARQLGFARAGVESAVLVARVVTVWRRR